MIARGEAVCPPQFCLPLFKALAQGAAFAPSLATPGLRLTRRQQELLPMIARGLTNKEIASHLSELPQFINVLNGDMSVVGPRPERPHFVQKFLHEVTRYNNRHALKVGITGWAQVNGLRGDTSIEKRLEYDLYYLQNWSLAFDLRIIAMTVILGLVNRNAY